MKRVPSENNGLDGEGFVSRHAPRLPGFSAQRFPVGMGNSGSSSMTDANHKDTQTSRQRNTNTRKENAIEILGITLELKWLSLILLIVQNTVLVLAMRFSRTNTASDGMLYKSSTAVVMAEVLKLCISTYGVYKERESKGDFLEFAGDELTNPDILKLAVPGILYTIQNNLLFLALSNLEAAVYQVTYQLKILTTAMFSIAMLGRTLSMYQMLALVMLMMGVAMVQLSSTSGGGNKDRASEGNRLVGVTCVLLACVSSGFAGVYTEKILKHGRVVSLFTRNMQLAVFGIILGLLGVIMNDAVDVFEHGFFSGYTPIVWLVVIVQAAGGLMIAVVMKYADNILKGFATSISIILSSVLSSLLFGFSLTLQFVAGTTVVIGAVFLFGVKPRTKRHESSSYDIEQRGNAVGHRPLTSGKGGSQIASMLRV